MGVGAEYLVPIAYERTGYGLVFATATLPDGRKVEAGGLNQVRADYNVRLKVRKELAR